MEENCLFMVAPASLCMKIKRTMSDAFLFKSDITTDDTLYIWRLVFLFMACVKEQNKTALKSPGSDFDPCKYCMYKLMSD